MSLPTEPAAPAAPGFGEALRFWAKLGWISFGGPAGQIAVMHRELVERRRWVDESAFLHGLNYCMVLPGPEAMQLATWLGWRLHGLRGGLAAGALFVLPAVAILALLSWAYLRFGELPAVAGALFGIQAATLALVVQAIARIGRRVLRTPMALALAAAAFLALFALQWSFVAIVLAAALVGIAQGRWRPGWLPAPAHAGEAMPVRAGAQAGLARAAGVAMLLLAAWWLPLLGVRAWLGADSTAWTMGVFFSKAALVTLGGAYAVLPYVAQQAVEVHGWLTAPQMLVGLGLAESTPGPLIMVLEFVGFVGGWQRPDLGSPLASALLGAAVTVWATFLPSFLFVLPAAPWIERLRSVRWLAAALVAVTAAVVGAMASLALWFGWHLLAPLPVAQIAFAAAVALAAWWALDRRDVGTGWVVLAAAALGTAAALAGFSSG
ncbi:chromate efflux transporter [Cognatilysobacter tabacisoli]|uniref:chromate efflux transporter n=1 Tax=Cognatilysobacter tabacisoli TaxID=2315424 RepID=UPI0018C88579|nr:chromate efflux transporter [Lysobacter tabacisoli]